MTAIRYIVTHPGQAHRDDFLGCCLALHVYGCKEIFRRDPTPEELADASVLIIDVGGQHASELNNFDHHHFPRDYAPTSGLEVFAKSVEGLHEALSLTEWYSFTSQMDSKGPFQTAALRGWKEFPFAALSPVEATILKWFEGPHHPADDKLIFLMEDIGCSISDFARGLMEGIEATKKVVEIVEVGGIKVMYSNTVTNGTFTGKLRDRDYPDAAAIICHDDRGSGWTLYRYDDDARIDFSRVRADERTLFAHVGGFIAKTKTLLPREEVLGMMALAIK
jgi:hypothetical protein